MQEKLKIPVLKSLHTHAFEAEVYNLRLLVKKFFAGNLIQKSTT
jgi:hypothetical protein